MIYIMDADGGSMRQLTYLDDDSSPTLSPDGTQVAFVSLRRNGNYEIYVINTDGSGLNRLTTNPGSDMRPAWSPDGSQIVYTSCSDNSQCNIIVMGADGSNPHSFSNSNASFPRWSPDGSQIVFTTFQNNVSNLNIMIADGSNAQVIKTNQAHLIYSPVWSPDGSKIAFLNQKTIDDPVEVDVIDKDGKNQHSLTVGYYVNFGGLSWSPDGRKLIFTMNGDGKSGQGDSQLYIVNADGSDLHKLDAPCTYCYGADWGP
jgi:Tol biopolymer transport system component